MSNEDMKSIFEQINNLKKPVSESREEMIDNSQDTLHEVLSGVSEEIQRVLDENNFTREFDTLKCKNVPQSLEIDLFFCQIFIFII